ncbi:MAG: DUF4870 domain-containing protein [Candidatus Falkowbacteria bacterium]|nr:DUF4870 domain-containing protein [Candidatus Falkowbacteria bacterium]
MPKPIVFDPDVQSSRLIAALSYFWILFLIPLLLKRDSKFAQFHAKQGLVLFIVEFIVSLIMWVPLIGQVLFLATIVLAVAGIVKAYSGEWWKLPFIYKWSEKIKI